MDRLAGGIDLQVLRPREEAAGVGRQVAVEAVRRVRLVGQGRTALRAADQGEVDARLAQTTQDAVLDVVQGIRPVIDVQ